MEGANLICSGKMAKKKICYPESVYAKNNAYFHTKKQGSMQAWFKTVRTKIYKQRIACKL